jgi:hypothetical protein
MPVNEEVAMLLQRVKGLEEEIESHLAQRRAALQIRMHHGKVAFEREIRLRHRALKTRLSRYVLGARPLVLLTAPLIYMMIVPFVLLDLFITVYQSVCFAVYGIEKVKRADYLVFDRAQLAYLNGLEKLNCAYCSYANGLVGYVREIASRTEQYWCPIKHAQRIRAAHEHYQDFVDYGDAEGYLRQLGQLRRALASAERAHTR